MSPSARASSFRWFEQRCATLDAFLNPHLLPKHLLGAHVHVMHPQEVSPPTKRKYLFNMMTSLSTNPVRATLSAEAEEIIDASFAGKSTRFKGGLPEVWQGFVHNIEVWQADLPRAADSSEESVRRARRLWTARKQANANEALTPERYKDVLLQSVFTLSPSGHNPETFRLFEAAEAGSIPVVDRAGHGTRVGEQFAARGGNAGDGCEDPWAPFVASEAPFVWVNDWSHLRERLEELRRDPEKVVAQQRALLQWYERFMTRGVATVEAALDSHEKFAQNSIDDSEAGDAMVNVRDRETKQASLLAVAKKAASGGKRIRKANRNEDPAQQKVVAALFIPLVAASSLPETKALAGILERCGVQISRGDTIVRGEVAVDWRLALDQGRDPSEVSYKPLVHVVRHPLRGVELLMNESTTDDAFWTQAASLLGVAVFPPNALLRAVKFWIEWNNRLAAAATSTIRAEDVDTDPLVLVNAIRTVSAISDCSSTSGPSRVDVSLAAAGSPQRHYRAESGTQTALSWNDVRSKCGLRVFRDLAVAAVRYGYSEDLPSGGRSKKLENWVAMHQHVEAETSETGKVLLA